MQPRRPLQTSAAQHSVCASSATTLGRQTRHISQSMAELVNTSATCDMQQQRQPPPPPPPPQSMYGAAFGQLQRIKALRRQKRAIPARMPFVSKPVNVLVLYALLL
jgi:hypothetical protein